MKHFCAPDGRRIAYESQGAGHPVLCLAGLTRNMRDFDSVAAHLEPRFRVIRIDSRGRGGSDHAEDPMTEYSLPVEAGDVLALLEHLGIERTAIIGTSRGGIIGMSLASARKKLVSALVLNDVGAQIEMLGLTRIMVYLGRPPKQTSFAQLAADLKVQGERQFPGVPEARWLVHAHACFDADPEGRPVLSYDRHLRTAIVAGLDDDLPHVSLWPLFDALLELPILVIRGSNSDILTAETVEEMREAHPILRAVEVADRGHAPFLDEPEAVAAIDDFLDEYAR